MRTSKTKNIAPRSLGFRLLILRLALILGGALVGAAAIWTGGQIVILGARGEFDMIARLDSAIAEYALSVAPGIVIAGLGCGFAYYAYRREEQLRPDTSAKSLESEERRVDLVAVVAPILFVIGIILAVLYAVLSRD